MLSVVGIGITTLIAGEVATAGFSLKDAESFSISPDQSYCIVRLQNLISDIF